MNKSHNKFVLPTLLTILFLSGCSKVTDVGVHHCQDGKTNYKLEMYSGEHKGYRDNSFSTATDVYLEVKPNNLLGVHYKVNGLPQGTDDKPYETTTTLMVVSFPFEQVNTDPSTGKKWIYESSEDITIDMKTGELKRTLTEKHLDMKREMTSIEIYNMETKCY